MDSEATHVECEFLSSQHPHPLNIIVVILAKNHDTREGILSQLIQPLEHPRDQVAGHEDLLQVLPVLVAGEPDAPAFLVKVLPEVRDGFCGRVLVGIASLEGIQRKWTVQGSII